MAKRVRSAEAIAAERERLQEKLKQLKAEEGERRRIDAGKQRRMRNRLMMVAAGEIAAIVPPEAIDMRLWNDFLGRHRAEVMACAIHPERAMEDAYDDANEYARDKKAAAKAARKRPDDAAQPLEEAKSAAEPEIEPTDDEIIADMTIEELRAAYKEARSRGAEANKAGNRADGDYFYNLARKIKAEAERRG